MKNDPMDRSTYIQLPVSKPYHMEVMATKTKNPLARKMRGEKC
jgi:hypothetical protein